MDNVKTNYNARNITFLVTGGTLSYLGDLLYLMALNIWIARVTGNPELLGIMMSVASFALFLGNPIGGILADRYEKRTLLIVTDFLSALAVILTFFIYDHNEVNVIPVLLCNITLSFCFAIYSPTARAIAPFVTSGDGLRKLNSLLSITGEITKIASPAIGGLLLSFNFLGEKYLILMNAVSFIISGIFNFFLKISSTDKSHIEDSFVYELRNLLKGYKEVWDKIGEIKTILISISLVNLFSGGLQVLLPFLDPTSNKTLYPQFLFSEGLGAFLGGVFSSRMKIDLGWKYSQHLLMFSGLLLLGLNHAFPLVLHFGLLFLFGFCIAVFNINFFTVIQKHADEKYIGRVFGLVFTFISALVPVGNLSFSKIEIWFPGYGIVIAGAGMIISIFFILVFTRNKMY